MLRLRDVFNTARWRDQGIVRFNMTAVGVLGVLMVVVTILTTACIGLPLYLAGFRQGLGARAEVRAEDRGAIGSHLVYFAAIGFGFMLIEISQVQRLAIFLGHPAYSLSVVLFSLLLSSGAGSLFTARLDVDRKRSAIIALVLLVSVLIAFGGITPFVIHHFQAASTPVRIAVSIGVLSPVGFLMGMAFPIGMRRALADEPSIAPWLWGVNGAASVCASVLVVVIALGAGISVAFWVGGACYIVAVAALISSIRA
jgi:hypothetical protein